MQHLWAPWRMAYLGSEPPPDGCFLCRAAEGSGPDAGHVVERAELTVTLLNRFPYNSGHLMVAPVRHVADLTGLRPDEAAAVVAATQRAMRALAAAYAAEGYNLGLNQGAAAGASIGHLHAHVVPRWAGDTNFMPVLAETKVLPEHLDATAERLRSAYAAL